MAVTILLLMLVYNSSGVKDLLFAVGFFGGMRSRGLEMNRTIVTLFALLFFAVPAFPKTRDVHPVKGVYPVSCDDLWVAVKETLGDKGNYALSSVNDLSLHASFIVVGDLILFTDRVTLYPKENGCTVKTDIGEVGAENTNWRQFHSRLDRTLGRLQAAKAKNSPPPSAATPPATPHPDHP